MPQSVLEGPTLPNVLFRATYLVSVVHLKDGVLAETDEPLQLLLVTVSLDRVQEVPPGFLRKRHTELKHA